MPLPLKEETEKELERMEQLGVISKVSEPTEWCAGMIVVPKESGKVRICVDMKPLNESVLREFHPLPKVDTTLAQLAGAKLFSKIDANSGFWQIPLSPESRLLTTFITPWGRYCFNKLPFGIASAPEFFQRTMSETLRGLPGVANHTDDSLIFGKTKEEHNARLHAVLRKLQSEGLTLNQKKCKFHQTRIEFLGHIIDGNGVSQDPKKTEAIQKMKAPSSITELRRFMGMVNQLNKFSPRIADLSQPLRELLSPRKAWVWTGNQEEAFVKVKNEISSPRVLALFDVDKDSKISADASSYGLGSVLLQRHGDAWKPVAFASRCLTETESRYAQIEKEALALTWACEKFSEYILGKLFELETDHKPLVPILGKKCLDSLPPRVLRFRLTLMRFQYTIYHCPGKALYLADTLSRAPLRDQPGEIDSITEGVKGVEKFVEAVISALPADQDHLERYAQAQAQDTECSKLIEFCKSGWPNRQSLRGEIRKYWQTRSELSMYKNLLLFGSRIVVPKALRKEILEKIHKGHQGILRCRLRVSESVWWPGVSVEVEQFIKSCPVCQKTTVPAREPLIPSTLPSYPWERVAADLFELKKETYLLIVDYYSRYVEVKKITSTTAASVVTVLKSIFARHGIPATMISDNGPQFACREMKEFAETYGFHHITSSPLYPQANGQAERAVKTTKQLLANSPDPYMALLSYSTILRVESS